MSNILPASNIVNVTITDTPSGLTEKNVNSLAIFTQDTPINLETYGIYISASEGAANYGTNSKTAKMLNAIFSQVPNVLTGGGRVVVIPMQAAVSATKGSFATPDISANLAGIIAVASGDIKMTINGTVRNFLGINFTGCETFADIAALLQSKVTDATVVANGTGFTVFSNKVGTASTAVMAQATGGSGIDMSGANYFKVGTGTAAAGVNSSGETILQCIARTSGFTGYVPIISTLDLEDAAIAATAAGIEALDNMFLQHVACTTDIAGIGTTISQAGEKKTRVLLYTTSQADANLYKAAYAGRGFSVDFTGSNTSQTMNLKQLATIVPDPGITQTLYEAAKIAGVDLYVSYDGVPSVLSTGGNDFFDNPYSDLALKFYMTTAGFNFLRQTNTKVPQTEQGMNGLKNAYAQICEQFIRNGEIAPGEWNSSETFGDPEVFTKNIRNYGYYVYSIPIALQNSSDREQRKAPLVQIAIKRAGAIHTSNVIVLVND